MPRDTVRSTSLQELWSIAEETAAENGKAMRREDWHLVIPVHLAESRAEAIEDIRLGGGIGTAGDQGLMVALAQRIIKLEKKLANRSQIGPLGERVMYQPSEEEFAEAMEILVACGAMSQLRR